MKLKRIPQNSVIEILGHKFNGLKDIEDAVEVSTRISNSIGERYIRRFNPENPASGIHVLKLYEPYPCFDSSDFLYENRRYCNYFFSKHAFSDDEINKLAELPGQIDYCIITEGMDNKLCPAIYFRGNSFDDLIVAL